jgi:hypothetical protein
MRSSGKPLNVWIDVDQVLGRRVLHAAHAAARQNCHRIDSTKSYISGILIKGGIKLLN